MSAPSPEPVAEVVCGRLRWHIPHPTHSVALKFMNNDTHPLYDAAALADARRQALEDAARACEALDKDFWNEYKKGRRSSSYMEGKSDGAAECAAAIRALIEP